MNCQALNYQAPVALTTRSNQKAADAPTGTAEFSQNPQDKVVLDAGVVTVTGLKGGASPQTEKAALSTELAPNADGKYVYPEGSTEFHESNSFSSVANTIKFWEDGTGSSISWAFGTPQLGVVADGGEMLNAYYQRQNGNVNFFHATDPVTNKVVYSGDSAEVVSHETGHAILDAFRPGYLGSWKTDPGAFHESFGDMMGLLKSLQDDRTVARVVEQTGGDMRKSNIAANLGEELGITINNTSGRNATGGDYTRTAINDFTWQDPSTLPNNPSDPNKLGHEVHNFSRLWTGAFYDVFCGLVKENQTAGMDQAQALREASNTGLKMLGNLLQVAPKKTFTYAQMAQAFVQSERDLGGNKHTDLVASIYKARKILPDNFTIDSVPPAGTPDSTQLTNESQAPVKEHVKLDGNFGKFSGMSVQVERDPSERGLTNDDEGVKSDLKQLIADGKILYTEPNQAVSQKDLIGPDGHPYVGVVRWSEGQPVIERNTIVG